MAKAPPYEEQLSLLRAMRDAPAQFDLVRELSLLLRHKSNRVLAKAAELASDLSVMDTAPAMVEAFRWLIQDAPKRDPGCTALRAIATAMTQMDYAAVELYQKGLQHVQMEGSFGPPIDVAAPLRGLCIQGLVLAAHPDALREAVTLLTDRWPAARAGAVRALGASGQEAGELLLRLKALHGDEESEVIGECFAALLSLAPSRSLAFVARFLRDKDEDIAGAAALALGESRQPAAFPILRDASSSPAAPVRRILLLGIAMLRHEEAIQYLVSLVETESGSTAADALAALALYRHDGTLRSRLESILNHRRPARAVTDVWQQEWDA